jgi:hypothetical protein
MVIGNLLLLAVVCQFTCRDLGAGESVTPRDVITPFPESSEGR